MLKAITICLLAAIAMGACTTQPLEPTADVKRVSQVKVGQRQSEIEAIMGRKGSVVSYSTKQGEILQVWPYADHFLDLCLMVTYDREVRAAEVASVERERGLSRVPLPGGCR